MAYGDPFDAAGADMPPQQAGGVSPDFWRNLAMFGSQMSVAANARTPQGFLAYGNGFAGPFGAGIQGGMQNSMDVAKLRSNLGLQQAQTQDVRSQAATRNIQNKLGLYNLNLTSQLYGGPQFDEQGNVLPQGQSSPYSVLPQGQPQSSAAPASSSNTPFAANNPLNIRYAGQDGATNTNGFAAFPTPEAGQAATDNQFKLYADRGVNTLNGLISTWAPPSENDTAGYVARVSKETGIAPDAPIDLHNPAVAAVIQRSMAGVEGNGNARVQVAQAGNGPIPLSGASAQQPQQSATQPQPTMNPLGIAQGILTGRLQPTPQQALAAAPLIGRINPQLGQELMQFGLAGAKAASVKAAELPYVGPTEAAKSANSNVDLRPGGMARIQTPNGPEWVKNPQLEKIQNPDGSYTYAHITPPLPGAPDNTPGQSTPVVSDNGRPVMSQLAPNVQAARTEAYKEFAGKDTDSYLSAQNTHAWLEQMDHAADALNQGGGFLGTGPTSPSRLAFANNVNDILRTAGLPNAFDASKIASWEELKKATTTAGFELSSHYEGHARQAAQTIENATAAVPSASNSPVGFHVVSAGIREAAQSAIDLHNFKQQIYTTNDPNAPPPTGPMADLVKKQGADLTKAEVAFYEQNPAQMYARRAISSVTPYTITEDKQLSRYLPGTFLQYKGKIIQVPERPGAPPMPEYLKNATPPGAPQ